MINITNILTIVFFLGLYMFLSSFFISPSKGIERAVSKERFTNSDIIQDICRKIQNKIYNHVELSEQKEALVQSYLINEKRDVSAKDFITYNYAQTIFIIIIGAVVSLVTRSLIVFIPFLFLSFVNYKIQEEKISNGFERSRNEIEKDISKFCTIIAGKLKSTNNVENIIKSFLPIANSSMRIQLETTLADMRTGSVHTALTRLEQRVLSRRLSEITRGLKAVANGDDQQMYFIAKEQEFRREHQSILEKEIDERTRKLLPAQIIIVVMFVLCILYPFGITIVREASQIFGM